MAASTAELVPEPAPQQQEIPLALIRETIDGIPFYYRGYTAVLNKTKTLEQIMADSGLQIFIKTYLGRVLSQFFPLEGYHVFVGETGSHADHRSNLSLDVCVYDKAILTPAKITTRYVDVPPKLVIEVDVKVELPNDTTDLFEEFVLRKVRRLFKFGTERVIWVFSRSKTIVIASPDGRWEVQDWDKDVELTPGLTVNIAHYLEQEGILLDPSF